MKKSIILCGIAMFLAQNAIGTSVFANTQNTSSSTTFKQASVGTHIKKTPRLKKTPTPKNKTST